MNRRQNMSGGQELFSPMQILFMLTQQFGLMSKLTIQKHPELIRLVGPDEDLQTFLNVCRILDQHRTSQSLFRLSVCLSLFCLCLCLCLSIYVTFSLSISLFFLSLFLSVSIYVCMNNHFSSMFAKVATPTSSHV